MGVIDDEIADLFSDEDVSYPAIYTPATGGPALDIRVLFSDADKVEAFGGNGAVTREVRADIQLALVPTPAKGDTLAITLTSGVANFRVKSAPLLDRIAGMANLELTPL